MATQRLVAAYWTPLFPYATSVGAGAAGVDVLHTGNVALEVKARRDFNPTEWMRQAARNAVGNQIPMVVMRPDGAGEATIDDWPTFVRQQDAVELVRIRQEWLRE